MEVHHVKHYVQIIKNVSGLPLIITNVLYIHLVQQNQIQVQASIKKLQILNILTHFIWIFHHHGTRRIKADCSDMLLGPYHLLLSL